MNCDFGISGMTSEVKRLRLDTDQSQSDEEFMAEFNTKNFVFIFEERFKPYNCAVHPHDERIYFSKQLHDNYYCVRNAKKTVYAQICRDREGSYYLERRIHSWIKDPFEGKKFKTMYALVEEIFEHYPPCYIHYERGVINTSYFLKYNGSSYNLDLAPFFQDEPCGTYIIKGDSSNTCEVILKQDDNRYKERRIYDKIGEEIYYEKISSYIEKHVLHVREQDPLQVSRCQTFIDISFLTTLNLTTLQREFNRWTPKFLKGIKHLILNSNRIERDEVYLRTYVALLICLARLDRTDIQIHIIKDQTGHVVLRDTYCRQVLAHMRLELHGEPLRWAMDKFLEIFFYHTYCTLVILMEVEEDSTWHELYDNPNKKPNLKVVLSGSERTILVHDGILAKFSNKLKTELFQNQWGSITFEGHPDGVVEQFLRVAYGFIPDFSRCRLVDLLKCAKEMDSPYFLHLVNRSFNDLFESNAFDKCPFDLLKTMIEHELWMILPDKTKFFELLGKHWSEFIENLPTVQRDVFRDKFLNDWGQNLSGNDKLLKV